MCLTRKNIIQINQQEIFQTTFLKEILSNYGRMNEQCGISVCSCRSGTDHVGAIEWKPSAGYLFH